MRLDKFRRPFTHPSAPYIGLLSVYTLLALSPLFAPGYFYSAHDGRHSVFYLMMFDASIRDGALWPRWAMHHIQGYGYPTFIIQAPIGFYVGQFFVLLGAGYTVAVKLTWLVGFLFSGWGMYALVLHWLRRGEDPPSFRPLHHWSALAAGLLYVFIPYHLAGIYVRAALNDTLLFAWFPWVFLAFDRLIGLGTTSGWPRRLALAALLLAGTLLTHTFALLSFTPLLIVFVLFRVGTLWLSLRPANQTPVLRRALSAGGLAALAGGAALLLSATFLFPLLVEGQHLEQNVYVENSYHYHNHFVYLGQFFSPFWGFGFSDDPQGANDGMGFQLGLMALLFALAAVVQLVQHADPHRLRRALMAYLLVASALLVFLMTPAATPIWDAVPPLALIQFPWRLLSMTAFTLSALAGLAVANLLRLRSDITATDSTTMPDQNEMSAGAILMAALIIFGSYAYVSAPLEPIEPWREDGRAVFQFEQEHPDMIAYTTWVDEPFRQSPMTSNYQDEAYQEEYGEDGFLNRLAIIAGSGEILSQYSRGSSAGGIVHLDEPSTVRVHLLYFPGWQATLNGAPIPLRVSPPHGLIELDVPPGRHRIDVRMGATPVRTLGTIVSWSTLLVLGGLWAGSSLRARRNHSPETIKENKTSTV